MRTNYTVELQIVDSAFTKLEAFIKKASLNADEVKAFSEMLKAGFHSSISAKKNKKSVTILTFAWKNVDDILLSLLQRYGRFTSVNDSFVMNIVHQELYGKLLENLSLEEESI